MHDLLRFIRRFAKDRDGLALIEFAFVAPIMILLYLGGFQALDGLACKRKVTITTRAVADLVSQYSSMTSAQVGSVLSASTQIMVPYKTTTEMVRVSELYTDTNGNTTVKWSQAINGTKRSAGAAYTLPSAIATKGAYLIIAETSYVYKPPISFQMINGVQFSDSIYMSPRVSSSVACNDC